MRPPTQTTFKQQTAELHHDFGINLVAVSPYSKGRQLCTEMEKLYFKSKQWSRLCKFYLFLFPLGNEAGGLGKLPVIVREL